MRGSGVCPFLFVSFIPSVDQELRVGFSLFLVSAMFGRLSASSGWARPCWGVFVVVPFRLWLGRD